MKPKYVSFGPLKEMGETLQQMLLVLRGNLNLHDQLSTNHAVDHTFGGVANTEEDVDISTLDLEWIPQYVVTLSSSNGGVVYASNVAAWTTATIKLKCTSAGTTAKVVVL